MHQQFEDLMYKAGITAQGCWDEMDEYDRQAIEKFAKLIILECDKYARSTWEHGALLGGDLKRLFGMEE